MVEYRELAAHLGYRVGDDGTVWSRRKSSRTGGMYDEWRKLKPHKLKSGHRTVTLTGRRIVLVHRLVLETFVGPCPAGMECRHLNDDPSDNRRENLLWGTRRENSEDKKRNGRQPYGPAHHSYKHGKYAESR